jgi:hypothetical protein
VAFRPGEEPTTTVWATPRSASPPDTAPGFPRAPRVSTAGSILWPSPFFPLSPIGSYDRRNSQRGSSSLGIGLGMAVAGSYRPFYEDHDGGRSGCSERIPRNPRTWVTGFVTRDPRSLLVLTPVRDDEGDEHYKWAPHAVTHKATHGWEQSLGTGTHPSTRVAAQPSVGRMLLGRGDEKRPKCEFPFLSIFFLFFFFFSYFLFSNSIRSKFKRSSNSHLKIFQHRCKVHESSLFVYLLPYLFSLCFQYATHNIHSTKVFWMCSPLEVHFKASIFITYFVLWRHTF